ncbi:hypothetical protein OS493_035527 [Desmophyllum pertusum]|uniref:Poly [ADP-ribose] polymerase n=1 Tax=Desmophyllum pertusum TaxID=174260 RepID=A0A9W9YIF9_9CNID|nr:hypothetical protein OS493_035527 [Desmophyllum pertusum]
MDSLYSDQNSIGQNDDSEIPRTQLDRTDEPQADQPLEQETKKEVFLAVDPDVIGYIYETSNYKDQLKSLLEEKEIDWQWKEGNNFAAFEINGDCNEDILKLSVKTVQSFLGTFVKYEIPVEKHIWDAAVAEISSYGCCQGHDPPMIQTVKDELKLRIAFVENNVMPKCKDVEVEIVSDEESQNPKVWLKGPKEQLDIAMDEFLEQEIGTSEKPLNLPQNVLKLLIKKEGKDAIEKVLEDQKLNSVIKFNTSFENVSASVLGNSERDAREAVSRISEIAAEEKVEVDQQNVALKSRAEWTELCEEIKKETDVLIQDEHLPVTLVVGFTDDVKNAVTRLQQFVDRNLIRIEQLICPSKDVKQYIRQIRGEDLRSIETELVHDDVKILDDNGEDGYKFYISGRGEGLQKSKTLLAEIIDKTVASNFTIEQPGLRKTFGRGRGDSLVKMVGTDQKCLIRIEKKFWQNNGGDSLLEGYTRDDSSDLTQFVTPQGHRISIQIGNIAEEQVHTVVCPEGECSGAIQKSSPAMSQYLGGLQVGDISFLVGVNLPCQYVIHTRCSNWNGGRGEETLRKIVRESLYKVEHNSGDSIAIPDVRFIAFRHNQSTTDALRKEMDKRTKGKQMMFLSAIPRDRMKKPFQREKGKHSTPTLTTFGRAAIEIITDNLTRQDTDAIVNTINADMKMRNAGQLSSVIAQESGPGVEKECESLGLQPGGTAVITRGGKLKARYIIHLIPISSDKQHLQKCLEEGLRLAEANSLQSISIPAIGTGGHGMSAVQSANMIFQALQNVCKDCVSIRKVNIVVFQDHGQAMSILEAFEQEQKRQQNAACRDKIATQPIKQTVRVWVTGSDEGVSRAVDALNSGFTDECLSGKVKDEGISKLSDSQGQVRLLFEEAHKRDIEMTFDASRNHIKVRGDVLEVPKMVEKIYQEISKRKQQLEEEREYENAQMVSKTVQWAYKVNETEAQFDLQTNHKVELAHSKEDPSIKVSLRGDEFVIDLKAKTGCGQHHGEQLTLIRKLKNAEDVSLPETWSPMTSDEVQAVPLNTHSKEYENVSNIFYRTAKQKPTITRIDRVQNPFLFRRYMVRKQKMDKDNGRNNVRQLFHGTSSDRTMKINAHGFNRSFSGEHGECSVFINCYTFHWN